MMGGHFWGPQTHLIIAGCLWVVMLILIGVFHRRGEGPWSAILVICATVFALIWPVALGVALAGLIAWGVVSLGSGVVVVFGRIARRGGPR